MTSENARAVVLSLTNREREMLALRCDGWLLREIAAHYFIEEGTVRSHFSHMFPKLRLAYVRSYQARWDIVKKVYCPIMAELASDGTLDRLRQQEVEVLEVEPPPSPEILALVEADERYLLSLRETGKVQPRIAAPVIPWQPQPRPKPVDEIVVGEVREIKSNPWRLAFILLGGILLGALLVGGAVWAWISSQATPTPLAVIPTAQPTQAPAITREVVIVTATPLPATHTPLVTDTALPTETLAPTQAPTETPRPAPTDTSPGTVLGVGDYWLQNGVALRIVKYTLWPESSYQNIGIWFDLSNLTGADLLVSVNKNDIVVTTGSGRALDTSGWQNCLTQSRILPAAGTLGYTCSDAANFGVIANLNDPSISEINVQVLSFTSRISNARFRFTISR